MANERTFTIVKPNAVSDNNIGNIISRFESEGLRLAASKFTTLSKEKAEGFYIEHKERPFFGSLVNFMTSGPVLLIVLEGENAVKKDNFNSFECKSNDLSTHKTDFNSLKCEIQLF